MFGLRLMFVFFWFCLVFFGLDLETTKNTQGFLFFWIKWWLKNCEKQKNSRFFCFSLRSQKETKATTTQKPKKTLERFCFHNSLTIMLSKKQKNLSFFSFFKVKTQKKTKNTRQNPKKTKHEPQTKHSLKSFVFLFFGFLEFFFDFVNGAFPKSLQILFFVGFLDVFCFFGFSPWILSQRVVKYCFFVSNLFW